MSVVKGRIIRTQISGYPLDEDPPDAATQRTVGDVRGDRSRALAQRACRQTARPSSRPATRAPVHFSSVGPQRHAFVRVGDDVKYCQMCKLTENDPGINKTCAGYLKAAEAYRNGDDVEGDDDG